MGWAMTLRFVLGIENWMEKKRESFLIYPQKKSNGSRLFEIEGTRASASSN